MKLVSYESERGWRSGIQLFQQVVDAAYAAKEAGFTDREDWSSTRRLLGLTAAELRKLEQTAMDIAARTDADDPVFSLGSITLGPPIPDPEKIVCLGLNYLDHAKEANLELPKAPMLFAKYRNSLVGPKEEIVLPTISDVVDYEAELAVVIGKRGKNISEQDALTYVAGAMALNDVSARDVQTQTSQWMAGKAIDTFAPCGPALVTMDEIPDIQNLGIVCRVNGQVVQQANTSLMIFSVAYTISYISQLMTLEPGDIIATGTPAGVGFKRNPKVLLHDGDVVEVEIERIGTIRNPVVESRPAFAHQ